MSIDKFNNEGYFDPTTYAALTKVEKEEQAAIKAADFRLFDGYRPLVYICSPFSGNIEENIKRARRYSRFAVEHNTIPITPHLLYPQFMDDTDPAERHVACHKINYVLIGKCEEIWVFGSNISKGMEYEISIAQKRRQTIRYFSEECKEVSKNA